MIMIDTGYRPDLADPAVAVILLQHEGPLLFCQPVSKVVLFVQPIWLTLVWIVLKVS